MIPSSRATCGSRRELGPAAGAAPRKRKLNERSQRLPLRSGTRATQRRRGTAPGAVVSKRARKRAWCVAKRSRAARARGALHLARGELHRMHVVRVRASGVRRGRRHGLDGRTRAHIGISERGAAYVSLASHSGLSPRARRLESRPSPWRHCHQVRALHLIRANLDRFRSVR